MSQALRWTLVDIVVGNHGVYPHGAYSLMEEEDKQPGNYNIV